MYTGAGVTVALFIFFVLIKKFTRVGEKRVKKGV